MPITMTMKDAALESGLSVRLLYRLIGQGRLKSRTIGRRRLIDYRSLHELVTGAKPAKQSSRRGTK